MKRKRDYLVLTAMGADRVGLVEELSHRISSLGCNIEDSRMALLGGEFSIIMLLSGEPAAMKDLSDRTEELEAALALSLRIKNTAPPRSRKDRSYKLETVSPDEKGLVHLITGTLKRHGANIEDMKTEVVPAPWTGTPMFHLKGTVTLASESAFRELRDELIRLEAERELDIFLKAL